MKIKFTFISCLCFLFSLNAQVSIGTYKPSNPGAALDVANKGENTGILFPRVALTNVEVWGMKGNVATDGMVVFNTNGSVKGITGDATGIYYWSNKSWKLLIANNSAALDPSGSGGNAPDYGYDVILLAGQSNTHYGFNMNAAIDTVGVNVKQLGRLDGDDMKVIAGKEPLDNWTRASGRISFASSFGNMYAKNYLTGNRKVLIVPCGYSATSMVGGNWRVGDPLYKDAVKRTNFVLDTYLGSRLVAILWHQGEYDAGNANYQGQLDAMINGMRKEITDASKVPFLLGGMVPDWVKGATSRQTIQNIIANTVNRVPNTGYADSMLPTVLTRANNSNDQIHYDATQQRELAKRYFEEYKRLRN